MPSIIKSKIVCKGAPMDVKITPKRLNGIMDAPSSKFQFELAIALSLFSKKPTTIKANNFCEEVETFLDFAEKLGKKVAKTETGVVIENGITEMETDVVVDLKEGNEALWLLPIVSLALQKKVKFFGENDVDKLIEQLKSFGAKLCNDKFPFCVQGKVENGNYSCPNLGVNVVAFLVLLSTTEGKSTLTVNGENAFADIAVQVINAFGGDVEKTETGYLINGKKELFVNGEYEIEGGYLEVAPFISSSVMGNIVRIKGLSSFSSQNDKKIYPLVKEIVSKGSTIDLKDNSDLVCYLGTIATFACGRTVLDNVSGKEVDVLAKALNDLGGNVEITGNSLVIVGTNGLKGGTADGLGYANVVMALIVAGTVAETGITVKNANNVEKIYPNFYKDFEMLGGACQVL